MARTRPSTGLPRPKEVGGTSRPRTAIRQQQAREKATSVLVESEYYQDEEVQEDRSMIAEFTQEKQDYVEGSRLAHPELEIPRVRLSEYRRKLLHGQFLIPKRE